MANAEDILLEKIASFKHDPLGFVLYGYPWGEPGPLERYTGPDDWQREILIDIGERLRRGEQKIQVAVASGKGIGKSALICMVSQWAACTLAGTRGVITAGTEPQLRTKTMPEFGKWFQMAICKHWFANPATSMYARGEDQEKIWRLDAIPWNAANPEAFAGLHNHGKRIVVVFDEASQIDEAIWNTTDGIMSDADTEVIWICFGNPTRGAGKFFDCFHRNRHRWITKQIDSRTVKIADKSKIQEWVDDYGEDSDYVRVNVRGMFPRVSTMQFIGYEMVQTAAKREALCAMDDPLIIGVDVARFGDDCSVICFRKGRDARTITWLKFYKVDTMALATAVSDAANRYHADAIHVDGGGVGGGVVDRLRQMGHSVRDVKFGASADRLQLDVDATRYGNKRSEMWGYMREALAAGLAIPEDPQLEQDLTAVLYGFRDGTKGSEIMLESKEHMRARGESSPDVADALALTYAYPAQKREWAGGVNALGRGPGIKLL